MKILKLDNFKFGVLMGFIGLFLGLVAVYLFKFRAFSFGDFLHYFFNESQLLTSIGSLTLLANIALFTVYINSQRDKTAKGIFTVTVMYGIAILLLKVI